MSRSIVLMVLIGAPAAGKTTLAKSLKDGLITDKYSFIHICYDALLPDWDTLQGDGKSWRAGRQQLLTNVSILLECISNQKPLNECPTQFIEQYDRVRRYDKSIVLVFDDNMYYKSMRYSVYSLAKIHNISYCQLYLPKSIEEAMASNRLRSGNAVVAENVISNIIEKMEPPDLKNRWERNSLTISEPMVLTDSLLELIEKAILTPEEPDKVETDKSVDNSTIVHKLDLLVRKMVGKKLASAKSQLNNNDFKNLSLQLCERKAEFLANVRCGLLYVPSDIGNSTESAEHFLQEFFLNGDSFL